MFPTEIWLEYKSYNTSLKYYETKCFFQNTFLLKFTYFNVLLKYLTGESFFTGLGFLRHALSVFTKLNVI